jgi:SAM-dependent methyltransferase
MTGHHELTRNIYQKQHERISSDEDAAGRIFGMYETSTMGMPPQWFSGKEAIDVGCGNIGALISRLRALGVKKCFGIDVGTDWIRPLETILLRNGFERSQFDLRTGSVLAIPFADDTFDFTAINGVLIHLADMSEIEKGFMEGARITKRGGALYTSWGPCGGLIQGVIFPAIRNHYRSDPQFRAFIDNISPEMLHRVIDKVVDDTEKFTSEVLDRELLKSLFGMDYCVFLQNFIQAPTWFSNECTPELVESLYSRAGFANVRRLNSFVKRSDIRKFFAPLHYDRDYDISKILYGQGYVQYIGEKPIAAQVEA